MRRSLTTPLMALALLLPLLAQAAMPEVAHRLQVTIDPESGVLTAQDQMRLPDGKSEWSFLLDGALAPRVTEGEAELIDAGPVGHLRHYRLRLRAPGPVTIGYGGRIQHALERIEEGMGRAHQRSLGAIRPDGVFLDGNSGWYPRVPDTLQTFQLEVQLPEGWTAVSQGAGPGAPDSGRSTWTETHPQDDIYLIAGPYRIYRADANGFEAQVYLREPDAELAKRYLDATREYVAHYAERIGPYPFAKFALVENFWETGYGMPSFTLLGSAVIRLPFILHTSYPHEILHNWWGNSVFIDHASGNWSEGLTNYQADYWQKELAGQGRDARRDMLKGYADHVREGKDFPLVDFRGRHDLASQGIGYNKGAMFFHMLRGRLGETHFNDGLRRFYTDNQFRAASYGDLRTAFERVSGQDLSAFFEVWTTQPGAPRLALGELDTQQDGAIHRLSGQILQTQPGAPFPLRIPLVVEQETGDSRTLTVESDARETAFTLELPSRPVRIAVDPQFDLFRELMPGETPVSLSALFGSDKGLILLPSAAPEQLGQGYARLARAWQAGHPDWRIAQDEAIASLPNDRPVWLLGWENRHLATFGKDATEFSLDIPARQLRLGDIQVDTGTESPVLTRTDSGQPRAWLATADAAALAPLARKLPHYGKYSYLVFTGAEATNKVKGQWSAGDSELVRSLVSGTADR